MSLIILVLLIIHIILATIILLCSQKITGKFLEIQDEVNIQETWFIEKMKDVHVELYNQSLAIKSLRKDFEVKKVNTIN